jgi:hypothetical protein
MLAYQPVNGLTDRARDGGKAAPDLARECFILQTRQHAVQIIPSTKRTPVSNLNRLIAECGSRPATGRAT